MTRVETLCIFSIYYCCVWQTFTPL